jgi:hypothetical protein
MQRTEGPENDMKEDRGWHVIARSPAKPAPRRRGKESQPLAYRLRPKACSLIWNPLHLPLSGPTAGQTHSIGFSRGHPQGDKRPRGCHHKTRLDKNLYGLGKFLARVVMSSRAAAARLVSGKTWPVRANL